jgi:hypothetical protein
VRLAATGKYEPITAFIPITHDEQSVALPDQPARRGPNLFHHAGFW